MIKKSLGQNFFINEHLGERIINYIAQENPDLIVEIGPGRGFFTQKLAKITSNIVLVEKDDELASELQLTYPRTVNVDFLDWDFKELIAEKDTKIVFFGSLPYNVSKPIIQKIISSEFFNNNCYFIIQKEVAEKYISKSPNSNILSLKSELFASATKLFDISPGSFFPPPKVTSSLIKFTPKSQKSSIDNDKFTKFLELSFRSPRKTLRNNLKGVNFNMETTELLEKRPQELCLEEYLSLFNNRV